MNIEAIENTFRENFTQRGELGASVSIWKNGEELLSLSAGWCEREKLREWNARTLIPFYSATKAPAAATLLYVLSKKALDETSYVREIWPTFPVADATFAQLLSHQCGLAALEGETDMFDHSSVISAVEKNTAEWMPGQGHGYHPRTIGFLIDECVRRLEGRCLGEVWNEEIAIPLGIDFWIGLPLLHFPRVAKLVPGKAKPNLADEGFYAEFHKADSLTRRAFSSPKGLQSISEMNEPRSWAAGFCAMGGIGTAGGLAKFYQAAIGALDSPFSSEVKRALSTLQISGQDRVLLKHTAFTSGCQMDPLNLEGEKIRHVYGNSKVAFGHPGAGGSHGFGDPASGVSFGYGMNQMELNVMPGERCLRIVEFL